MEARVTQQQQWQQLLTSWNLTINSFSASRPDKEKKAAPQTFMFACNRYEKCERKTRCCEKWKIGEGYTRDWQRKTNFQGARIMVICTGAGAGLLHALLTGVIVAIPFLFARGERKKMTVFFFSSYSSSHFLFTAQREWSAGFVARNCALIFEKYPGWYSVFTDKFIDERTRKLCAGKLRQCLESWLIARKPLFFSNNIRSN